MPLPSIADILKCKLVSSEMTAQFDDKEIVSVPAGKTTVLLKFPPSKVELHVKPAGEGDMKVMICTELWDFLMKLADEGPEVEREEQGTVWKFTRV